MKQPTIKLWRLIWYCVVIWLLAFTISGVVILPWFYLVLPLVVLLATVYYFDKSDPVLELTFKKIRKHRDRIFALGLLVSTLWFIILLSFSFFELANFYYFDFVYYFSDPRNWLLYPLVLLVPVVYSLLLEQFLFKKPKRRAKRIIRSQV